MKKVPAFILIALLSLSLLAACGGSGGTDVPEDNAPAGNTPAPGSDDTPQAFAVSSNGIQNGTLSDYLGARGTQKENGIPTRSMDITLTGVPDGAVCFALVMRDPDSVPLCGYEWLHWAVVFESDRLEENASVEMAGELIQAKNGFDTVGYGGPTPPDKTHTYVITVYALDAVPALDNGFSLEQLQEATEGHILAEAEIPGAYAP